MIAEPITLALGVERPVLGRVGTANPDKLGKFVDPSGTFELQVRHNKTRARKRTEIVVVHRKIAENPLTSVISEVSSSSIITFDQPLVGYSVDEAQALIDCVIDFAASSAPRMEQILAGQS